MGGNTYRHRWEAEGGGIRPQDTSCPGIVVGDGVLGVGANRESSTPDLGFHPSLLST